MINLHNKRMHVIETAANGIVNDETIFVFHQKGARILARYRGGKVRRGVLVGSLSNNTLSFNYAQEHADAEIAGGQSKCSIKIQPDGKYQLIESFEWDRGIGKNIFEELD